MTSARSFRRLMAELDSSHTHPLISFKYQDQSPGSLMDASHSSKHCWPTSGQGWRGLGTRGLGRGLFASAALHLKTGFPQRNACCPPLLPSRRVALEGGKQSLLGVASPALLGEVQSPITSACQPAWIPSPAPETSLTTSPISQASPGGRRPAPRVG